MLLNEQKTCGKCSKEVGFGDSSWDDKSKQLLCTDCSPVQSMSPEINLEREAYAFASNAIRHYLWENRLRRQYKFLPKDQQDELVNKYRNIVAELDEHIKAIDRGDSPYTTPKGAQEMLDEIAQQLTKASDRLLPIHKDDPLSDVDTAISNALNTLDELNAMYRA